ncbi:MAG TPA: ferredoxin reductase [Acidimicrobiales bacterium]|nr:ferredoxin reductase [Acidimicrobiales bacterium]
MFTESLVRRTVNGLVHGRIVAVDRSATSSVLLTIEPNRNWAGFRAGQYTQLSVEIDGVRHTRCYSMCSVAGTDRRFQLGIKAHPDGLVSQWLVANAAPGMLVGLTPAAGEFVLPDARPTRTLLVSGGSGITPVLSMLRTLCAEGHTGPVTFLHFNQSPEGVLCGDEIAALAAAHPNVRVVTAYNELLTEAHLDAADPQWRDADAFVCGPAPMMDAVRGHYAAAGAPQRFHHEAFTLTAFVGEAGDVGGAVRFAGSALEVASDGRTLLEQAEAAGLTPQNGCRMGICHTCPRRLARGTVRNVVTGELTSDPDVNVRICVSVPVGDVEIDL